ncbi:MAG: hypothetical protein ACRC5B_06090 [Fusobacteriaceae bacterium]
MGIPFLLDYLVQGKSEIGRYLLDKNINFLGDVFTPDILLLLSWLSYIFLISYVFKAFKNLKIEGFKMMILVVYNLFLQIDRKSVEESYYFWIVSIILIFIIETIAVKYAPENRNVIDITPEEEKEDSR